MGPILIKIVPQKDTIGEHYFEYSPKEKEVYLLTVILTFLNIILAAGLCIASILFFIFTEVDPFIFLYIMTGYGVSLGIIVIILELINFIKSRKK